MSFILEAKLLKLATIFLLGLDAYAGVRPTAEKDVSHENRDDRPQRKLSFCRWGPVCRSVALSLCRSVALSLCRLSSWGLA